MTKKSKVAVLDSTAPYDDAKARLKHQTLLRDYEDLQKDTDITRNKLEAAKQRKLILAAEVRFLRQRYRYLVKAKNMTASAEPTHVQAQKPVKQTQIMKEQQFFIRNKASEPRLHPVPEAKPKKKQSSIKQVAFPVNDRGQKKTSYVGKEATRHSLTPISTPVSDLNYRGIIHVRKDASAPVVTSILGRNQNESANDAALRRSIAAFDLNQDSDFSVKEASLPSRAPIFDLNEISTGDEDFQSNYEAAKLKDVKKSLIRDLNDEEQNDLKLSICRSAGEGSSRVGKRKISWQDPVALRV